MQKTELHPAERESIQIKRLAAAFIPLLLCCMGGAIAAFLAAPQLCTEQYYVSCPIGASSVYGVLSSLALYLESIAWQLLLIFLSAFALFPTWLSASVAIYRGVCTGISLFAVSHDLVTGTGSPEASVLLYFLSSVLLLLLSSRASLCAERLQQFRRSKDQESTHALLFAYLRSFLVLSGGAFAVSAFAVIL